MRKIRKISIRRYFRRDGTKVRAHTRKLKEYPDRSRQTRIFEYDRPEQYSYVGLVASINEEQHAIMSDPNLSLDEREERKKALEYSKRALLSQMQQEGRSEMELYSHKRRKKRGKKR